MVKRLIFPVLIYGKKRTTSIIPGRYEILSYHHSFDPLVISSFQKARRSFQWSGTEGMKRYKTCYGIWPYEKDGGQIILMRFIDIGRGSVTGRLHNLRIEAALVKNKTLIEGLETLACLCNEDSWPNQPLPENKSTIKLKLSKPHESVINIILNEWIRYNRRRSMLIGDSSTFRNNGFEIEVEF